MLILVSMWSAMGPSRSFICGSPSQSPSGPFNASKLSSLKGLPSLERRVQDQTRASWLENILAPDANDGHREWAKGALSERQDLAHLERRSDNGCPRGADNRQSTHYPKGWASSLTTFPLNPASRFLAPTLLVSWAWSGDKGKRKKPGSPSFCRRRQARVATRSTGKGDGAATLAHTCENQSAEDAFFWWFSRSLRTDVSTDAGLRPTNEDAAGPVLRRRASR